MPALIEALKDLEPDVRRHAGEALEQIQDPAAVPALTKALNNPDRNVRAAVRRARQQIKSGELAIAVVCAQVCERAFQEHSEPTAVFMIECAVPQFVVPVLGVTALVFPGVWASR